MRVAFNSIPQTVTRQLAALNTQQNRLQNQVATGKRISQLDDDPAAMRHTLDLQAKDSQITQYRKNIANLQSQAAAVYTGISGLQTISAQASQLATLAADDHKSPQQRSIYASEVNQLIQQGVQDMNSTWEGSYLFGGTRDSQPPYVTTTDASGNITGVAYQGNDSVPSVEIAKGTTVSVLVPGANTSGSGPAGLVTDTRSGADFFNHLISLRDHMLAGNTTAISSQDVPALAKDETNITSQIAENGLNQTQLSAADSIASAQSLNVQQGISQDSDADLAQTLTQLSATQVAYQAALQSGARLLSSGHSLLDYLQ
jgi:flagellar hook-associated protein 3 FlgL